MEQEIRLHDGPGIGFVQRLRLGQAQSGGCAPSQQNAHHGSQREGPKTDDCIEMGADSHELRVVFDQIGDVPVKQIQRSFISTG